MKVTCENCSAVYKIPDEKLTKEVNRATCKKCGNKLLIRKSSVNSDENRKSWEQSDDEPVINHEERTVISDVPELQKYDNAPVLPGSNRDLNNTGWGSSLSSSTPNTTLNQSSSSGSLFNTVPNNQNTQSDTNSWRPPMDKWGTPQNNIKRTDGGSIIPEYGNIKKTGEQDKKSGMPLGSTQGVNEMAREAQPVESFRRSSPDVRSSLDGRSHSDVNNQKEQPPQYQQSNVSPQNSNSQIGVPLPNIPQSPTIAISQPPPKANVVDMFSQSAARNSSQSFGNVDSSAYRMGMILALIGVAGVLCFIKDAIWGITTISAAGFFLALYGSIAAFFAQWDLANNGRINPLKVFLIPAIIAGIIIMLLMKVQEKEVAFLYEELDGKIALVGEYLKSKNDLEETSEQKDMPLPERIRLAMKTGKIGKSLTEEEYLSFAGEPIQPPTEGLKKEVSTTNTQDQKKKTPPSGIVANSNTNDNSKQKPVASAKVEKTVAADLDDAAIDKALEKSGINVCFMTGDSDSVEIGKLDLKLVLHPEGRAESVSIVSPSKLKGTRIEECVRSKILKKSFPAFEGSSSTTYFTSYTR